MNNFNFKNHKFIKKQGENQETLNRVLECIDYVCKNCSAQLRDGINFRYIWLYPEKGYNSICYNLDIVGFENCLSCADVVIKKIIE